MRANVSNDFVSGFSRGVLHFLVLVLVHFLFIFVLVTEVGGVEAGRRWLHHGRICCFEICDTLFEIAEVVDAGLISMSVAVHGGVGSYLDHLRTERIANLCIS